MSILMTGFGPFPGVPRNASQQVVEGFPDEWADQEVHRFVLPTIYDAAGTTIDRLLVEVRPDICLCLGVAGDPFLRLETVARNHGTVPMPDESGIIRSGPIAPAGPDSYPCTLPFTTIHPVLKKRGMAVELSDDAGGYVCNHVFYTARHAIERHGLAAACGFVHVPPVRSVDREGEEIDGLIRAVQTIVVLLVDEVEQRHRSQ